MTNNFYPPITPTPELVQQWRYEDGDEVATSPRWFHIVCTKAARWGADQQLDLDAEQINQAWQKGADQELEACCKLLELSDSNARDFLYSARRPKPPSLKEEALEALKHAEEGWRPVPADCDIIRRALEALPD